MPAGRNDDRGPDLAAGVALADIPDGGVLAGHVDGTAVLLSRRGDDVFAIGATCSHYGGPLGEGLVLAGEVRCPWHHARFDLRDGRCLGAPALAHLPTWQVLREGDRVRLGARQEPVARHPPSRHAAVPVPARIVILGGGGAGAAAALRLRELGWDGELALLSDDPDPPYDRPNLSKDYLAGEAEEGWMPLKSDEEWRRLGIEVITGCRVEHLDRDRRELQARDGRRFGYERLLLATGAEPGRLDLPGFDDPAVHSLRTLADCRALIGALEGVHQAVLVGAGFIGLEAAAALRHRGLEVAVVAPEEAPMARILGPELAACLVNLHREHGVRFHLGRKPVRFEPEAGRLVLDDGTALAAGLVLVGVGARPRTTLAEQAGLDVEEHGVVVDRRLCTPDADIFAVGDIARFPWRGEAVRIEHWVHAQRQGEHAAAAMLGDRRPFTDVPFFWTHHYDMTLRYSGHARGFDQAVMEGTPDSGHCSVRLLRGGTLHAGITLGEDRRSLEFERELGQLATG